MVILNKKEGEYMYRIYRQYKNDLIPTSYESNNLEILKKIRDALRHCRSVFIIKKVDE